MEQSLEDIFQSDSNPRVAAGGIRTRHKNANATICDKRRIGHGRLEGQMVNEGMFVRVVIMQASSEERCS